MVDGLFPVVQDFVAAIPAPAEEQAVVTATTAPIARSDVAVADEERQQLGCKYPVLPSGRWRPRGRGRRPRRPAPRARRFGVVARRSAGDHPHAHHGQLRRHADLDVVAAHVPRNALLPGDMPALGEQTRVGPKLAAKAIVKCVAAASASHSPGPGCAEVLGEWAAAAHRLALALVEPRVVRVGCRAHRALPALQRGQPVGQLLVVRSVSVDQLGGALPSSSGSSRRCCSASRAAGE